MCYDWCETYEMEIHQIRLERLRSLVDRFKSIAAFARYYNLEANYISHLFNGYRSFGERSARQMEKKMGLEPGYFDTAAEHPLDAYKEVFDKASLEAKSTIINFLKALQQTQSPSEGNDDFNQKTGTGPMQ